MWTYLYSRDDESKEDKKIVDDDIVNNNIGYAKILYKDEYVRLYKTDARDFIKDIYNIKFQRQVDYDHVEKLKQELIKSNHCVGTFKAVYSHNNNKLMLIDGQHRVLALHDLMLHDAKFNINIILEVYEVKTEDEQKEWFRRANNVKNIEEENLPNVNVDVIVDYVMKNLKQQFSDNILEIALNEKRRVYRPRIDENILMNHIKKYVIKNNITDAKLLYKKINQLNNYEGMKGKNNFKQITNKMWEKAKETGFYIGLYQNVDDWINKL